MRFEYARGGERPTPHAEGESCAGSDYGSGRACRSRCGRGARAPKALWNRFLIIALHFPLVFGPGTKIIALHVNIIIVGGGEVGRHLAQNLSTLAHNISIIESSERVAADLNERLDVSVICDNGASVTALAEANVADCDLFLALTSEANTNLVAASLAKAMGARKTIARVNGAIQQEEWLFDYKAHFNIDYLFSSQRLAAVELAKYVRNPEGVVVEELARGRIELQQVEVSEDSEAVGKSLRDLGFPPRVRVAFIQRKGASIVPTAQHVLEQGDLVTLFGEPAKLQEVLTKLQPQAAGEEPPNVVIFGGGEAGFALAQMLEGTRCRIRILEPDPKLCEKLSDRLHKTVVINGDPTSLQLLREEQVSQADFFVATSRDDEDNVMTCLQARNLGTKYCLALIHRADYADVISRNSERLGILAAVNNQVTSSRDLLRFVTSDRFHVLMSLAGGVEVVEAIVGKESKAAEKKISEISWPDGSGLVALLHGQSAVVPGADDVLEAGDTIYGIVSPVAKKAFVRLITD